MQDMISVLQKTNIKSYLLSSLVMILVLEIFLYKVKVLGTKLVHWFQKTDSVGDVFDVHVHLFVCIQGWCGWKGQDFWDQTVYYNLCLPQIPKVI